MKTNLITKIELTLRLLLGAIGILLLLDAIFLTTVIRFNVALAAVIGLGSLTTVWALLWNKLKRLCQTGWKKWAYRTLCGGFVIFTACLIFIGFYGSNDNVSYDEEALIVLGAGIRGESVTMILKYRLDAATTYYEKNPKVIIVVSGGQGEGESISEALAMEKYLLKKGIPQEQILLEDQSTSTAENFQYSQHIIKRYFKREVSIAFTTNTFHIFRGEHTASANGLKVTHLSAAIDPYMMPVVYIREVFAIVKYLLNGEITF